MRYHVRMYFKAPPYSHGRLSHRAFANWHAKTPTVPSFLWGVPKRDHVAVKIARVGGIDGVRREIQIRKAHAERVAGYGQITVSSTRALRDVFGVAFHGARVPPCKGDQWIG